MRHLKEYYTQDRVDRLGEQVAALTSKLPDAQDRVAHLTAVAAEVTAMKLQADLEELRVAAALEEEHVLDDLGKAEGRVTQIRRELADAKRRRGLAVAIMRGIVR